MHPNKRIIKYQWKSDAEFNDLSADIMYDELEECVDDYVSSKKYKEDLPNSIMIGTMKNVCRFLNVDTGEKNIVIFIYEKDIPKMVHRPI